MSSRSVTVSFGDSSSGTRSVKAGPGYSQRLRDEGWCETLKFKHHTAELGVVAVKIRWENAEGERCFTSYRCKDDVPVPLLFSAEVAEAEEVWLSESHSDALALRAAGVVATTNWGAAGTWCRDDANQLRGKHVILVRHRDAAGHKFAEDVRRSLRDVTVVEAPEPHNDARDALEAGLTLDDFVEVV